MNFIARSLLLASLLTGCAAEPIEAPPPPVDLAHPPARPAVSVGGTTRWFVVDSYRLGVTDRNGAMTAAGWKQYGYDLDGRATSREDSRDGKGACRRPAGAPTMGQQDGVGGIDNNFGQHFVPVVKTLMYDVEKLTNERVANGGYTLVLRIDDVSGASEDAYAPGALYFVGHRDKPKFTADEKWPVAGTKIEPIATFPAGYVSGGTWVSGDLGAELKQVALPFLGDALLAPLFGGVLTLGLDSRQGTMAGAVRTTDFLEAMKPSLVRRGVCPGTATYDQYISTVTQSSDMLATLPLAVDPSRTCDAVSLGVGFTVAPIAGVAGTTGAPEPPESVECKKESS